MTPRTLLLASLAVALGCGAFGPPLWAAPPGKAKSPAPPAAATASAAAPAGARDPLAVAAAIDAAIDAKLSEAGVPASAVCDDAEFIRRLSLDVRGRTPSPTR